jgi:hypothetical protein
VLEEALTLLRQLGDRTAETDALCHLGLACHAAGESHRGLGFLDAALALARGGKDRCAEKLALDHPGVKGSSTSNWVNASRRLRWDGQLSSFTSNGAARTLTTWRATSSAAALTRVKVV